MDRKRTREGKKKWLCFFFIFTVMMSLCFAGAAFASSAEENPLGMEVSYGFQDTAKGDRYLKVDVFFENRGEEDFSGSLELLTTESSLEVYRYDYPVLLAAGEKTKKEYYIPLGVKTDQMFASLMDEGESEVLRKRLKLNISSDVADSFVGVFSDEPEELAFFDEVGIHYGSIRTKQILLDSTTAPDNPKGYDQLDLVLVSDYDLNRLSGPQRQALERWVENGGTLLLGGGSRCRENMGWLAEEILESPLEEAVEVSVNLGEKYAQSRPQEAVLPLVCVDLNLKNGSVLLPGDGFPLLSYTSRGEGRIVAAAFALADIGEFSSTHPSFLEELLSLSMGENKINQLAQMEYTGFSSLYFNVQGLINTGSMERLPNLPVYVIVIVIYLLLIGPGIYLCLRKRGIHRFYMVGAVICAFVGTGVIYLLGVGTRFTAPFFTYAAIRDVSEGSAREEIYLNVRSPYNRPYLVSLSPDYNVRPVTKSYYYDSMTATKFTGEENYKTNLRFLPEKTEIRIRDTVAFTPKLFMLERELEPSPGRGITGSVLSFDGELEGSITNGFDCRLEDAILLLYGKAVILGDLEPGQEVSLEEREVLSYPLSYTYALAQHVTGGDQFEKAEIDNEDYLRSQERSRLMSFYLNSWMNGYMAGARVLAFAPEETEEFLMDDESIAEGLTMITAEVELSREKNGRLYRCALEQEPGIISGNYIAEYNSMYIGEPAEPATVEYFLGNDLEIEKIRLESLSTVFLDNPQYPYLSEFKGKMYFYNYDTGRNDLMEWQESYTARELKPYLSPANTITVKYVNEGGTENGWERQLPMIYVIGREK